MDKVGKQARVRQTFGLYEKEGGARGKGNGLKKQLISGLQAADARTFDIDHSVVVILSMSMTCLCCTFLC